jgi:hypothetical protein
MSNRNEKSIATDEQLIATYKNGTFRVEFNPIIYCNRCNRTGLTESVCWKEFDLCFKCYYELNTSVIATSPVSPTLTAVRGMSHEDIYSQIQRKRVEEHLAKKKTKKELEAQLQTTNTFPNNLIDYNRYFGDTSNVDLFFTFMQSDHTPHNNT